MARLGLNISKPLWRGSCPSLACCPGRNRNSESKVKSTPLPWGKLLLICSVLFVNQFGVNLIFPFLPYMIHDFFPELDRTQIGQKAGYLGCAYFVGNFLGSLFWGWMSDIVGRRPALLWGMLGIISSEVLFAFSQNFGWAVATRFLWGALNGNIGIGKTYISDISDDTNQARGFTMVGVTRGVGQLLGSLLGGFLAQPASKYTALQLPLFCHYPYALPVLIGAFLGIIALSSAWLFLDETLHKKNKVGSGNDPESSTPSQVDSGIDSSSGDPVPESDTEMTDLRGGGSEGVSSDPPLLMAESDVDTDDYEMNGVNSDTELLVRERQPRTRSKWPHLPSCNPLFPCVKFKERVTDCVATPVAIYRYLRSSKHRGSWSPKKTFSKATVSKGAGSMWEAVKKRGLLMVDRRVFFSTMLYGLLGSVSVMSIELLPLLLVTHHEDGGYSLDDNELGVIFMVSAVLQLLYHFLVFPKLTKLIGLRNTFRVGVMVFGLAQFLLPFSNQITGPILPSNSTLPDNDTAGSGMGLGDEEGADNYCGNYSVTVNSSFESSVNVNSVTRVPGLVWFVLITIQTISVSARLTGITATMVLINNSSLPTTKGMVNGIGQALVAIGRSIGPVIGAPLFAWSETTGLGWPLNFHFMFDVIFITAIITTLLSFFLPKSIERKRDSPPVKTAPSIETHSTRNSDTTLSDPAEESPSKPTPSLNTSNNNDSSSPAQEVKFSISGSAVETVRSSDRNTQVDIDDVPLAFASPVGDVSGTALSDILLRN